MYTFKPKNPTAKVSGSNLQISTKDAQKISRVIRGKKLKTVKRLLEDLSNKKRSLRGKYHTKAVNLFLEMIENCEKNAEFKGLDENLLFVHSSASKGMKLMRRRRKAAFGSKLKSTNLEIMLIEKGKGSIRSVKEGKTKKGKSKKKTREVPKKEPKERVEKAGKEEKSQKEKKPTKAKAEEEATKKPKKKTKKPKKVKSKEKKPAKEKKSKKPKKNKKKSKGKGGNKKEGKR